MKNKGFTLIEVLSVLILIGLLMTILIPSVLNIRDRFMTKIIEESEKNLSNAARLYLKYEEGKKEELFTEFNELPEYNYVMVKDVIDKGYIDGKVVEAIDYDENLSIVLMKKENDDITYEIKKLQPESCYTFNSSTNTITSYSSTCSKDVILPKTIAGTPVYVVGSAAFYYDGITSVIIPKGYTQIASQGFHTNYITSLDLPGTMKSVDYLSFENNLIASLKIPDSVVSIGGYAFRDNLIADLKMPAYLESFATAAFNNNMLPAEKAFFYQLIGVGTYDPTKLISYGGAERNNVIVPVGVETITRAFIYGTVRGITLPNTLKTIDRDSFSYGLLESVVIPNGVTSIGREAFAYNGLTNLSIPTSVTFIDVGAFNHNLLPPSQAFIRGRTTGGVETSTLVSYGGADRTNIVIPAGITAINNAFWSTVIQSVVLPSGLTSIGESAFASSKLASVTIPPTVTSIGNSAFYDNNLTSIAIPNSVTTISADAFRNNKIPQGSATIDRAAGTVTISAGAFTNNGANSTTTITPVYLR